MTYTLLIALEVLFWVLLLSGLLARYLLHQKKLSAFLLALAPLTDVALLGFTAVDIQQGETATYAHALAAIFIALSLTSGRSILCALDHQIQRLVNGQPLHAPKKYGQLRAQMERRHWFHHAGAFLLGSAMMLGMHAWGGATVRTQVFPQMIQIWSLFLTIDFFVSFSYTLWPKEAPNPVPWPEA